MPAPLPEAPPTEISTRQLTGLWEAPLFAVSLLLLAGAVWLGLPSKPVSPEPPTLPPLPQAKVEPPPSGGGRLSEALLLAQHGRLREALREVETLRATAVSDDERTQADLTRGDLLERLGDPASLAEAITVYEPLQGLAARFLLARARWRLFQAEPEHRDLEQLKGILDQIHQVAAEGIQPPLSDEAAFTEGQVLESLGRLVEAEAAYRRVGTARPALRGAALIHIAGCFRKRQPPALNEAHAAAMEAVRLVGLTDSPWMSEPILTRELELLAQDWRDGELDAPALELESALRTLAADPIPHVHHAAEIHERRAERLESQAAETPDTSQAKALLAEARSQHLEAGRIYRAPALAGIPAPYADLLFRSALAFERAGEIPDLVTALERFIANYPDDGHFPQAVYLLGRQYRALGLHDKALALFDRTRAGMREERGSVHYIPLSLYEEGLCQALSRTPPSRALAAAIFGRILDHPDIYPDSQTWRDSLFSLASLEHAEAMENGPDRPAMRSRAREHLEEWMARYPQDPRLPQARWMLGFLAFDEGDWARAALAFREVSDRLHHAPNDSQEPSLTLGRAAALLAAEAAYREGLRTGDRALMTKARDAFLEARDLNQGSWRAPWALARMGDCAQAMGLKEEATRLRQEAAWEYGQIGLAAGTAPEGTAGIQALIAWRTEALRKLGGP